MRGFKDNKDIKKKDLLFSPAFTLIELIVVVVVIAILAAIAVVGYSSWRQTTATAQIKSDLNGVASAMENYKNFNNSYPTSMPSTFTPSSGDVLDLVTNSTDYCIRGYNPNSTNNSIWNALTGESTPGVCANQLSPSVAAGGSSCPTGFIRVPGSSTYGTNDFCIMKYGAKNVGGVATSQAASTPWVSISQTGSITASDAACPGCHLISEARWLTIAQNVLNVASNWNGGVVGTSYIYSGHNDNAPANALAVTNTSDGYSDTGNSAPSNQRRTLTLSNGEVIWDLAGNVYEWTSGTSTTGQPGVTGAGYNWRQWTAVTNPGTISPNPSPSATGLDGCGCWNTGNGIGQIYSSADETGLRGFNRGGWWNYGSGAGVLTLDLSSAPGDTDAGVGFRVSR